MRLSLTGSSLCYCMLALAMLSTGSAAHDAADGSERLAKIGPAPNIELTSQDGKRFSLDDTRGKVVAVGFTYTKCVDTCPLLTSMMVSAQRRLGDRFAADVYFVTVTMDPEADRPEELQRYAKIMGCDLRGWSFLTGTEAEIQQVARDYGIFRRKRDDGEIDHTLLTSIIDASGTIRVQYIGSRFDVDEFLHDLELLIAEDARG